MAIPHRTPLDPSAFPCIVLACTCVRAHLQMCIVKIRRKKIIVATEEKEEEEETYHRIMYKFKLYSYMYISYVR